MKKIISILLALVLMLSLAISANAIKVITDDTPINIAGDAETEEEVNLDDGHAHIAKTVIWDRDGIKVTAKELVEDSFWGPEIKLLIENDSARNICVQARDASINGYLIDTMMSSSVQSGKKVNDTLAFTDSDMARAGITTIADMTFSLHIFDDDSWNTIVDTPLIQLKTNFYDSYEYVFDDSGVPIYDNNGLKIVVKDFSDEGDFWGPQLILYVDNKFGRKVIIQARDTSVNGFMVNPIMSIDIPSGYHVIDSMDFMSSDIEENGIKSFDVLEFSLHIFDDETWNTIEDTPPIKLDLTE